jgi:hypothetical protein
MTKYLDSDGLLFLKTLMDTAYAAKGEGFSGDYNDLTGLPTLGSMAAESADDYALLDGLAAVATSGSYTDLADKPDIPAEHMRGTWVTVDQVPVPSDASWSPPIAGGDYVLIGTTGTPATMYVADLTDDTWEAGASAGSIDAATVKALYESNADTNAFTDALLAKLQGIEAMTNAEIDAIWAAA